MWKLAIFDLDGLLVNTEMMHYRAYRKACLESGGRMDWDFDSYFQLAGSSSTGVAERLARENPHIFTHLTWDQFYDRKQHALFELLKSEPVPLMPGAAEAIERAHANSCPMACVTHSRKSFVDMIRSQHPVLAFIQQWYTRESYERAKPYPDGYRKAVDEANLLPEEVIGFEDSFRGLLAQMEAGIQPVLVSKDPKMRKEAQAYPSVFIFESLHEVVLSPHFSALFGS